MRIHGIDGNCVLLGPIRNSCLFGIDRIAGNRVLLAIFARLFAGKLRTQTSSVSSPILFSVQSLFFWELIFCMFCYSYTGIRIDGIVPKARAQKFVLRTRQ